MKNRLYQYILAASFCGLAFCGCSEETLTGGATSEGLTLNVEVGGQPAVSVATRAVSDPALNETVVSSVEVFFLKGDNVAKHVSANVGTDGKATLATGTWKNDYSGTYDVYVLANRHDKSDLSGIQTRADLLALTDTDAEVFRAEGENMGNGTYTGKSFLMDGTVENWNADTRQDNAVITVDLAHAAAKLVVNLKYTEGFLTEGRAIAGAVSKKLVHYTQAARAFAEGGTIASVELPVFGEAGSDGLSQANVTTNEETPLQRTDKLYAYSYPNEWGSDIAERETYFLVNVPYSDNGGERHENYYKVPIRVSGNADDLVLERNTEYTVNVTIDRLGNETIDEPKELNPTLEVAEWQPVNIDVDSDTPNYLVVSENYIELHNEADTVVTFFSSNYIDVQVTEAYYVNKYGKEVDIDKTQIVPTYNPQSLTGEIKITTPVPRNVTARYITLQVTNGESDPQTIEIVQYPLEYISGVPGWFSYAENRQHTRSWPSSLTRINGHTIPQTVRDSLDGRIGNNADMKSKFYHADGRIYRVDMSYDGWDENYYRANDLDDSNNRMYLVQITSTSGNYTVARPAMDGTGENIVTQSNDENNRLVSPSFMLASQLGTISVLDWRDAQDHCRAYVEVARYADGTMRRFADWRLPTYAELQVIAQYQTTQPDVMDLVLGGEYYWSAYDNRYLITNDPTRTEPGNAYINQPHDSNWNDGAFIRCIRDVTPEDLKEFRDHGIR